MYIKTETKSFGEIRILVADPGKKIIIDGNLFDQIILGKNSSMEDFTEVDDATYIPPETPPEEEKPLTELQENQIKLSKLNLSAYLETHPLFSNVKYKEGRYYTVTSEKQQQLTSKMMLNELYTSQGIPYELTWNDTGNICEPWTAVELATLSMQIDAYVTPLIKMQQTIEVQIKNAKTQEEVLQIDVTYSDENIQKYITES